LKEKRIAFIFVLADPKTGEQSIERDQLGPTLGDTRIRTFDQRFEGGLKESVGRIHGEILVTLMQAYQECLIETMIQTST